MLGFDQNAKVGEDVVEQDGSWTVVQDSAQQGRLACAADALGIHFRPAQNKVERPNPIPHTVLSEGRAQHERGTAGLRVLTREAVA